MHIGEKQDVEKRRNNQDKNLRDDDTTYFPVGYRSECWAMRNQDNKRILIAEMSLQRKIA